ncbi:MAG TPA: hypothetical protein VF534_19075 [Paraburkholderia sp.]
MESPAEIAVPGDVSRAKVTFIEHQNRAANVITVDANNVLRACATANVQTALRLQLGVHFWQRVSRGTYRPFTLMAIDNLVVLTRSVMSIRFE